MKQLILILGVILCFTANAQNMDSLELITDSLFSNNYKSVTSYSGEKRNKHFYGIIYEGSNQLVLSKSYTELSDSADYLFLVQVNTFYKNGEPKLDSLMDFSKRGKAIQKVKHYYPNGSLKSKKVVRSKLNPERTTIPHKSEVFWSGKLVRYTEKGKRLGKKILSGITS